MFVAQPPSPVDHAPFAPSGKRTRLLKSVASVLGGIVAIVLLRTFLPRGELDSQVARSRPVPGGIYSVASGEQRGVVKVLVVGHHAVHIAMYSNLFPVHPTRVDERTLTILPITLNGVPATDMAHLPLTQKAFGALDPIFIQQSSVRPEELEGYQMWDEGGGGLWDSPGVSVPRGS